MPTPDRIQDLLEEAEAQGLIFASDIEDLREVLVLWAEHNDMGGSPQETVHHFIEDINKHA